MALMTQPTAQQRDGAISELREILPVGTTVHSILRTVSSSGMTRRISFAIAKNDEIKDITWLMHRAFGGSYRMPMEGSFALIVRGTGMDMGFHVVYSLSSLLHKDGYSLKPVWL